MDVSYGLIGTSELLKEREPEGTWSFSGITQRNFSSLKKERGDDEALGELGIRIEHNLSLTKDIIEFIPKININHYRISSSIFSLAGDFKDSINVSITNLPNSSKILELIRSIGFSARKYNVTLSVYPDSTNNLSSTDDTLVDQTVKELDFHSWFFETAGFPSNAANPIIIKPFAQPEQENHGSAVKFVQAFYENFEKLNKDTQKRLVLQNEESGFWNPINLFKYFHVYLNEKYEKGMILSYSNVADERNPGMIEEGNTIEKEVNIGAFHETWMGVVPIFLWSEKQGSSNTPVEFLSNAIPYFNYTIKWECDIKSRDKGIVKFTMPEAEDKVTEEVIMTITKTKYKKSRDASRAFNALYDKVQ